MGNWYVRVVCVCESGEREFVCVDMYARECCVCERGVRAFE